MKKKELFYFSIILLISMGAIAFLFWIIYGDREVYDQEGFLLQLPLLNCFFNATSAVSLLFGLFFIKRRQYIEHAVCMIIAFVLSALFFFSYSFYHYYFGDKIFTGIGLLRPIYFFILISHILLTFVTIPCLLWTFLLAALKKWNNHRYWARRVYPCWLYISVTGILIYIFLYVLT